VVQVDHFVDGHFVGEAAATVGEAAGRSTEDIYMYMGHGGVRQILVVAEL
jgi:hypothetical protein